MSTSTPFASAYLRFLQLVSAFENLPGLEDFDANERALFETLALRWSQGQPLTVREAIGQTALGSPATLHKRLQRLINKGLVVSQHHGTDRRTKFLIPADKGLGYIEWLGAQMASVQES
jgi:DNA-binding MarR family transcriptional regulator